MRNTTILQLISARTCMKLGVVVVVRIVAKTGGGRGAEAEVYFCHRLVALNHKY